jgi:histidyl-tRNA synthetase
MSNLIEPRTLRGFRDYLPAQMIPREHMLESSRRVYRSYGFAPIDTPALEYAEILLGKGGDETDKQLYRFTDHGGRDIALRFDLTVPLARFVAQHSSELGLPFKRYHVGPVWRGENTQRGRYREFWQCDFDTIGTASNAADVEAALVIHDLMRGLGFERFTVRVNNRMVLNGLLEELGLVDKVKSLLIALDKLPKIGADAVAREMVDKLQVHTDKAQRVLALVQTEGTNAEILDRVQKEFGANARAAEGVRRLRELVDVAYTAGIPAERIRLDLAIARGLDYYTGTIYETFLDDLPTIGSVCSGGRYDNLAGLFTKQELPGVGASLGLDRLLAAMEELKLLPSAATPAPVFVVQFDASRLGAYQAMARKLRAAGIGVEVFPEAKKIGPQLQYAEKRGFKAALIAGSAEFEQGVWKIKNLATRTETTVAESGVVEALKVTLRD